MIYLVVFCNPVTGEHRAWGFRSRELRDAALARYPQWRFSGIQKIDAAWVSDDQAIADNEHTDINNTARQYGPYPKERTA